MWKCKTEKIFHFSPKVIAAFLSLSLVSCGGSNGVSPTVTTSAQVLLSPSSPKPSPPVNLSPMLVNVSYEIPKSLAAAQQQMYSRKLQYISSSNLSLSVVVTPVGGTAMAPVVGSCTTATCTVTFTANPGPNILAFTLTDTAGGGGTTLSTFTTMKIVQPGVLNTLALTANPIVNSVVVTMSTGTVTAGTPLTIPVTVTALDPDGKTIVGSGNYVDASGNPIALLLNTVNVQNGGSGGLSLRGPLRITASGQPAVSAYYNGQWLSSASVTVAATKPLLGSLSSASVSTTPSIAHEFSIPYSGALARGLVSGPDGNIWFTEQNGNRIGLFNMTTGAITEYPTITSPSGPVGITVGPDGNIWFVESGAPKIGRITTGGVMTEFTVPSGNADQFITVGPDGNLWFTEGNSNIVARITPLGQVTEFTVPTASSFPYGITLGVDGNLWFAEQNGNKIGRLTTAGVFTEYTVPTASSMPSGITTGSDGNLWFVEQTGNKVGRVTTSGSMTEFSIPTASSAAQVITSGPDGALYFVETAGNNLGRITTAGTITETPIPTTGSVPAGVTTGPDGNIWFTEYSGNKLGVYVF